MLLSRKSYFVVLALALCFPLSLDAQTIVAGDSFAPFYGKWSRHFTIMLGFKHQATYKVSANRIHYKLSGSLGNAEYTIIRDRFLAKGNRFVGHAKDGTYYVLFFKSTGKKEMTLYKRKVENLAEGLRIKIPSASDSQNRGWNTYKK